MENASLTDAQDNFFPLITINLFGKGNLNHKQVFQDKNVDQGRYR